MSRSFWKGLAIAFAIVAGCISLFWMLKHLLDTL